MAAENIELLKEIRDLLAALNKKLDKIQNDGVKLEGTKTLEDVYDKITEVSLNQY